MKLDAFDQLLHEERKLVSLNVPWFTVKYEIRNGKRVKVVATDMWGDGSDEFFNMVLLRTKRYEKFSKTVREMREKEHEVH